MGRRDDRRRDERYDRDRDGGGGGGGAPDLCMPPLRIDDLATVVTAHASEYKPNDAARCGYYFVPYETFEAINAAFGGCWVSDLQIEWDDASYAASATPGKDYSLVEQNTKTIPEPAAFVTPQPKFAFRKPARA